MGIFYQDGTISHIYEVIGEFVRLNDEHIYERCAVVYDTVTKARMTIPVSGPDKVEIDCLSTYLTILKDKQELPKVESPKEEIPGDLPKVNDTIEIIKGRKFNYGKKGVVTWSGKNKYGTYSVKFNMVNGPSGQWIYARNVKVINV